MPGKAKRGDFAFYTGGPVWEYDAWVKQSLLYFEGVALLVPRYLAEKPFRVRPDLAAEMRERGLLEILEPESVLDKKATKALADSILGIVASGALDGLAGQKTDFHHLSFSRIGYQADEELATKVYDALLRRGLAKPTEDRVSIPIHPLVRSLILVLLAPLLRPAGRRMGLELNPVTDRPELQSAVLALLSLDTMPSAASVFASDAKTAAIDVSKASVDEILRFREANRHDLDIYGLDLRRFMRDLGQMSARDRDVAIKGRQKEIGRAATRVRSAAKQRFGHIATATIGFAGAAWMATQGDLVSAAFTAAGTGTAAALLAPGPFQADAFSYLLSARTLA